MLALTEGAANARGARDANGAHATYSLLVTASFVSESVRLMAGLFAVTLRLG